ncbi:MAG TPA: tetratricopeptide repeat protein, partial [bacterium]|nr:tetratricopeptide repeat protein [bacterium]
EKMFKEALEACPGNEAAMYNLGVVLCRMGKDREAAEWFRKLMAYRTNDADVFVNLGRIFERSGKADHARTCYGKALELNPASPEALCRNGFILGKYQGKYSEAAEMFRRAIEIFPDYAEAHKGVAVCLHHKGDYDLAVSHLEKAISLEPNNPVLHNHLGIMLLKTGNEKRADVEFGKALALNPDMKLKHSNLWDETAS